MPPIPGSVVRNRLGMESPARCPLAAQGALVALLIATLGCGDAEESPAPLDRAAASAILARFEGTWAVTHRSVSPDSASEESAAGGMERMGPLHGGVWMWSDYLGLDPGAPFEGHLLLGWYPQSDEFVSCWIDSESPRPTIARGRWDAETEALVMEGSLCMPDGRVVPHRVRMDFDGRDLRTDTFWLLAAGQEPSLFMESACVRESDQAEMPAPLVGEPPAELAPRLGAWSGEVVLQPGSGWPIAGLINESQRALCGGRWLWGSTVIELPSQRSELRSLLGYDAAASEYVVLWINAAGNQFDLGLGPLAEGDLRQMGGESLDPLGRIAPWEESIRWQGPDQREVVWRFDAEEDAYDLGFRATLQRQVK